MNFHTAILQRLFVASRPVWLLAQRPSAAVTVDSRQSPWWRKKTAIQSWQSSAVLLHASIPLWAFLWPRPIWQELIFALCARRPVHRVALDIIPATAQWERVRPMIVALWRWFVRHGFIVLYAYSVAICSLLITLYSPSRLKSRPLWNAAQSVECFRPCVWMLFPILYGRKFGLSSSHASPALHSTITQRFLAECTANCLQTTHLLSAVVRTMRAMRLLCCRKQSTMSPLCSAWRIRQICPQVGTAFE